MTFKDLKRIIVEKNKKTERKSKFYFSAISVSQDMLLRQSIRKYVIEESKYVIEESKLIDSIGTAQMEQEIQNKVIQLNKLNSDKMTQDTGVVSSLEEEDMKSYLHEVLVEVGRMKKDDKKNEDLS